MKHIVITILLVLLVPEVALANFQSSTNYTRSPSGANPNNPITFSAEFGDDSGCPYATYGFWAFAANGTPLYLVGDKVPLVEGVVTQTVMLPDNVQIDRIRLACIATDNSRYDSGNNLENAFTPHGSTPPPPIVWSEGQSFIRSPSGATPTNPLIFDIAADDDTGCAEAEYSFWSLDFYGDPIEALNTNVEIVDGHITQTSSLDDGIPIAGITLACMDGATPTAFLAEPLALVAPLFTPFD